MTTTVFITGIEGFVGSHLARHLVQRGCRVSGIYLVSPTGLPASARVFACDLRDRELLSRCLAEARPGYVVHLAGVTSVAAAERDLDGTMDVNVRGTLQLLEAVRILGGPCRLLFVSSCEVYAKVDRPDRITEATPLAPANNYALSKVCAEQAVGFFTRRWGLDIVTLRSFGLTGPGQSTSFVFPAVARQIAEVEAGRREPLIEVGNTNVDRDYTDVRDVCQAYELALTRTGKGEVYNVTSESTLRVGEGIDYLVSLSRTPLQVRTAPGLVRADDRWLAGSAARFRSATDWKPEIEIKQTLREVLEYERGRVAADSPKSPALKP